MTPVQGWTEDAYYRARDRARSAFDRTNQQLQIGGLDEGVARAGFGPVPGCGPLVEPVLPHSPLGAGSPSRHTNGGAAPVPSDERGIPEEGA